VAKKQGMIEKKVIKKEISSFYNLIKDIYPVKKIILYGSYAKGKATHNSDIDVAVVVDMPDHLKRVEITASLFHYAGMVDSNIEPKCIFWDEYRNHNKASILSEIIKTGVEII